MYDYYIEKRAQGGSLQRLKEFQVWIFRLPMALPFYFLLSFFFFLPKIYCSCSPKKCGDITIKYPFYLVDTPPTLPDSPPPYNGLSMAPTEHSYECNGTYKISCEGGQAKIQFGSDEFPDDQFPEMFVMNISYSDYVLIINTRLSPPPSHKPCGFFVNFQPPFYNSLELLTSYIVNDLDDSPDCDDNFVIPPILSHELYNLTKCKDYNIHYWNESDHDAVAAQPAFEWILSFNEQNDDLSLMSFGFSQNIQFLEDCFNSQVGGKHCTSNNGGVNSICAADGRHSKRTIAIVVGFAGVVLACVSLALCLYKHKEVRNSILCEKNLSDHQSIEDFLEEHGCLAPKRYTYSQLKNITKSFKEELGQGGYGTVFKGTLIDGQIVAVKMLNESRGNGEEFMNEVASIGRTSHVNIVSLLGFCFEGNKRALVYDFMVNGSLEKLLYTDKPKSILEWEKLYQIAVGIARGLEYLHRGCKTRIVHFDIKPHNILLDQDFCPKISDFGLAKLCLMKESIISIAGARGTIGYIAPEVFSRNFGVVSSKSDVYSYGMMVLEMAEGKKNPNHSVKNSSEMYFPHWIYEHLEQNQDLLACGVNAESEETVRKLILVGLWCIQTLPQNRPSMSRVIEMLEGSVTDLQVPPKPYLSSSPFGSLVDASLVQDVCLSDDYSSDTS